MATGMAIEKRRHDPAPARSILAGQDDYAAGYVIQPRDHRKHRGFAASGVADETDEFTLFNVKVEILHND